MDFCYKCNKKHFPYGPSCPHKDNKILDYDKYQEKKKSQSSDSFKSTSDSNKSNGKTSYANNAGQVATNNDVQQCFMDAATGSKLLEQMALLQKKFDDLASSEVQKKFKKIDKNSIFIDTGCSNTSISHSSHSNTPIILNRTNLRNTIQTADGTNVDIEGTGTLLNHETNLVSAFTNSLLSVSQTTQANNAIAIFTENDCHIVKLDTDILKLLNLILIKAKCKNSVLLNGNVVNGLYICGMNDINSSSTSKPCKLRYNGGQNVSELDISSSHHVHFAGASYYTNIPSASVKSISDLVRFFHELWNHASENIMCLIINHKLILNLPEALTVKAVRKYFNNCKSCAQGNLQQRTLLSLPFDRDIAIGEEWECDILGPMTDENKKSCPSFSGQKYSLTCKDLGSEKRFGFLLRNKGYLLRYLKHLILLNNQRHRIVKFYYLIKILSLQKHQHFVKRIIY